MNRGRGGGLLHPGVIGAVALLLFNDHYLKAAAPGLVTGKLSDVAGLAYFPLFLQSLWEWCGGPVSKRALLFCCVATALVFAAVKTIPVCHEVYEVGLGWLQYPVRAWLGASAPTRVALMMDPTDLVALPAVGLAWGWGRDRSNAAANQVDK